MNRQEVVTSVIAISKSYNELAASISAKVTAAMQQGEIDFDHFLSVHQHVIQPLILQSARITFDAAVAITEGLDRNLQFIQEGSEFLKSRIEKIEKVEKIITVASLILSTAALVATFCAVPNMASAFAATESLSALITSLQPDENA